MPRGGDNLARYNNSNVENFENIKRRSLNNNFEADRKRGKRAVEKTQWDTTLLFVIIMLTLFGFVMVFSSSYYYALASGNFGGNMYYFLQRQLQWGALGLVAMLFLSNFDYHHLKKFTVFAYLFSVACLILVLFVEGDINGSKRWLTLPGTAIGFQPSEIAKFVIIVALSHYIVANKNALSTFKGFCTCSLIWAFPTALIAVENLSTALVVAGVSVCIMFVASPIVWYFFAIAGFGAVGVALMLSFEEFRYRVDRIVYWLDPFADPTGKGFQIIQSLYAVASGGLFGLGIGQSRQKTYVPEPYNDIIFAIICEELGMVGATVVIVLFAILISRGIKIAMNAKDRFGCFIATGLSSLIGIQVIINIAVATNSIPNTGMQLPFISYGGTGLCLTMAGMGILLNISRYQRSSK